MIMASMKHWLQGGELDGSPARDYGKDNDKTVAAVGKKRVVVVHCKAGKGRSGSMATSYLISECGWTPEDALARFTERRMKPNFGAGVSIPSQLRWVSYVDRWTKGGKKYVDSEFEIVEIHVWGLRHGVKVSVEGYADEGKKIRVLHTFKANERLIVQGDAPGGSGVRDFVSDMAGGIRSPNSEDEIVEEPEYADITEGDGKTDNADSSKSGPSSTGNDSKPKRSKTTGILRSISKRKSQRVAVKGGAIDEEDSRSSSQPTLLSLTPKDVAKGQSETSLPRATTFAAQDEPGGQAVILKPSQPIHVSNGDVNIAIERRNRAPASMGLTMVTAVAHVWFNIFFEGNGPEQGGIADDSGVFSIDWDRMDGIKGSSQKGTKAADRIAVVWRVVNPKADAEPSTQKTSENLTDANSPGAQVHEPKDNEAVPQMEAADWKGGNDEDPEGNKQLGLRKTDTDSEAVSEASTTRSLDLERVDDKKPNSDQDSLMGLKTSGPEGDVLDIPDPTGDTKHPTDENDQTDKTTSNR